MSSFDDLNTALASASQKINAVKGDTQTLLAKITELQSNPPSGMTPEQQAALDAAVTAAQNIDSALGELNDLVPDAAPTDQPQA